MADLVSSILSNVFLFLLIMGMAGTTDLTGFRQKLRNYRGIGTGLACQFLLLPFLGFASIKIFSIPRLYGIMLLIVTSSPGGGFSGWWCSLCNADLALSVAMTTVSTLFSVALLPVNLLIYVQLLYGQSVPLDWKGIMTSVAVVIGAVLVGLVLGTKYPQRKSSFNRLGTLGGLANIAVGVSTVGNNRSSSSMAFNLEWWWYAGIAAPCLFGLVIAFAIARGLRCTLPESVAICIECCYQNTALAIAVAASAFDEEQAGLATLVPLYYGVVEILIIALFALLAWQADWTYAPRTHNLMKCTFGTYQPGVEDVVAAEATGSRAEEGEGGERGQRAPAPTHVAPAAPMAREGGGAERERAPGKGFSLFSVAPNAAR